jgi:AcrR family transcriptional regulator
VARLDIKRIGAAALAVLDAEGVQGFTIRAVANKLGVTPMALYNHVPDKAGLVALVLNMAMVQRSPEPSTGSWRDDLVAVAYWVHKSCLAHPAVPQLQRMYRVWSPAMIHFAERWLGHWQQSGLPQEQALLAAKTSALAMSGLIVEGMLYAEPIPPHDEMLTLMPNAQLLFAANPDPEEMFELSVRAIIDGLYSNLSQEQVRRVTRVQARASIAPCKRASRRKQRVRA